MAMGMALKSVTCGVIAGFELWDGLRWLTDAQRQRRERLFGWRRCELERCGVEYLPVRKHQRFCRPAHKVAAWRAERE
jgi:hypothetical protein